MRGEKDVTFVVSQTRSLARDWKKKVAENGKKKGKENGTFVVMGRKASRRESPQQPSCIRLSMESSWRGGRRPSLLSSLYGVGSSLNSHLADVEYEYYSPQNLSQRQRSCSSELRSLCLNALKVEPQLQRAEIAF
ncbi:hypothetical protein CISG_01741 [Coccidioides immitis RMSCC 3703]|uniref:Uncharacterized protein n=1 Tax=Coccidioides immitis RMSCC 3703 TaxID=454286 RepID=A0A0J8R1U0_COCIT|nr:hypothetical protein CISG_01741 [Coccidioides immitis RMSCC 3703]